MHYAWELAQLDPLGFTGGRETSHLLHCFHCLGNSKNQINLFPQTFKCYLRVHMIETSCLHMLTSVRRMIVWHSLHRHSMYRSTWNTWHEAEIIVLFHIWEDCCTKSVKEPFEKGERGLERCLSVYPAALAVDLSLIPSNQLMEWLTTDHLTNHPTDHPTDHLLFQS